jgi:hypothetical protein
MRTDGLYSEYGRRDEDGRQSEAQIFSLGTGGDAGGRNRDVEETPWFEPVDSEEGCKDGFCPMPTSKLVVAKPAVDMVNHPPHYVNDRKAIETIDKIEDAVQFAPDAVLGGLQWQVIKYIDRMWDKEDPKKDAKKAMWYLNRLIQKLED